MSLDPQTIKALGEAAGAALPGLGLFIVYIMTALRTTHPKRGPVDPEAAHATRVDKVRSRLTRRT